MRSDNNFRKSSQEIWQSTVPSWEKKFCLCVGSIPWPKLLETKRYIYLYDSILKWNDSAGEEAFNNAKNRYRAKIHGLPCDISLPDPDIYIDDVDWDAKVDPELVLDLEREPQPSDDSNPGERVVILSDALLFDPSLSCTGWGDADENFQKVAKEAQNPGGADDGKNPWEQSWDCGNKDIRDDHQGWGNNFNQQESTYENSGGVYGDQWATWGTNSWKRECSGWSDARYKASRFPGDNYQTNHGWRDRSGSGRKKHANAAYEKQALRQWNMKSFAPVL